MSNISEKDIDRLFKQAAEGYNSAYDEQQWSAMEEKLAANTSSSDGLSFYKTIGGTIGGIIVVIALLLLIPDGIGDTSESKSSKADQIERTESVQENVQAEILKEKVQNNTSSQSTTQSNNQIVETKAKNGNVSNSAGTVTKKRSNVERDNLFNQLGNNRFDRQANAGSNANSVSTATDSEKVFSPLLLSRIEGEYDYNKFLLSRQMHLVDMPVEEAADEKEAFKKIFAVKLVFAPDLSSVGYFSPDSPGSNLGVIGEFGFAERWVVSTGAMLSSKKYYSHEIEESYGSYSYPIDRMDGKCKVIDIPLNVSYYLTSNEKHNFYVTSGLSSYIMLSEDYVFEYEDYYGTTTWEQSYGSDNKHFLGIVNFNIGYQRKLVSNIFLQIEPYLKAPITGIGEGKVDLVSSGAFFNLKYQLK